MLAGDIELNPGPFGTERCLSIIHQSIGSMRNKFDFIRNHYLDFDILCFTETHLAANIHDDTLKLEGFD